MSKVSIGMNSASFSQGFENRPDFSMGDHVILRGVAVYQVVSVKHYIYVVRCAQSLKPNDDF